MHKFSQDFYERKLSKRNHLIKRVRENYVRIDIPCGFDCCIDTHIADDFQLYIIPTLEIIKKYRALLKSDYCKSIICQSEYSKLHKSDQRRILEMMNKKSCTIFYNDFCIDTCMKGIQGVFEWYTKHLPNKKFLILDENNVKEYPVYFNNKKEICDLIEDIHVVEDIEYEEYIENPERCDRIIYKGKLFCDNFNWRNGNVFCGSRKIRILGQLNMNRAIHGDEVYVEEVQECNLDRIEGIDMENDQNKDSQNEDIQESLKKEDIDCVYGKVVFVNKKPSCTLVASILSKSVIGEGPQNVLAIPIDKKYPAVRIRTSQIEELMNKRLLVEVDNWDCTSKYPTGRYTKRFDTVGDLEGEIKAILISHNINWDTKWLEIFKKGDPLNICDIEALKVLRGENSEFFSLSPLYKEISENKREDMRHLDVFSIDPVGCIDVDDALHISILENGNYEVGVHIADVTQYVLPDSMLDKISSDRATTVYLPDRRIDMLPEFLSGDLCSLLVNKERGCFSVIWEIDKEANILSTRFCKGLIRSRKAFSYEEAMRVIQGEGFFKDKLSHLYKISIILKNRRAEKGALELGVSNSEEEIFTYSLIEEFMLLANISVAEFIYKNYPENALLRRHPLPSEVDLPINVDLRDTKNVNKVLAEMTNEKKEMFKKIITRAMNQATYVLSCDSTDFYHYGLATPLYTHFTSPIRRYADILVHRILSHILNKSTKPEWKRHKTKSLNNLNMEIINNINKRTSSARRCAWDVSALFVYQKIRDIEPITSAYITDIKYNGIIVYCPEYDIQEAICVEFKYNVFDKIVVKIEKDDELFYIRRWFKISIIENQW